MGGANGGSARLDRALDRLEEAATRVGARRVADATDPRRVADVKARLDTAIADIRSLLEG